MGEPEGVLVAIFITLVAGLVELAPVFTIVVVVVEEVGDVGDVLVVVLPDEITLVVVIELIGVLLLAIVVEPPLVPNELPPVLDANVSTGAALVVVATVDTTALEKLGAVIAGITIGVILLAVVCGPIAEHGGPPGQPVMSSWPLTKLRL